MRERLLFLYELQNYPYGSPFAFLYVAASLLLDEPTLNRPRQRIGRRRSECKTHLPAQILLPLQSYGSFE